MEQINLPLQTMFTVRVSCTIDFSVLAGSSKEAIAFTKANYFPRIATSKPKVTGVWRAEEIPAELQEDESSDTPPKAPPPRGRPNGGGTQGGGSLKPVPKPVDAIANVA